MTCKNQGKKRVLLYARYSTEDQNPRSIDDQFGLCKRWLAENGFKETEVTELSDEGISGECLSRPGIDKARTLIQSGKFDLVLGEEVSRFFRDRAEPFKLTGECIDNGTRLVAINDHVDTDRPGWERDLCRAADDHASSNEKTSARIKRAQDGRWENGYLMGSLASIFPEIGLKRTVISTSAKRRFFHKGRGKARSFAVCASTPLSSDVR